MKKTLRNEVNSATVVAVACFLLMSSRWGGYLARPVHLGQQLFRGSYLREVRLAFARERWG